MFFIYDRKQESLWAAGQEFRQRASDTLGKPQLDGCLATVVNNLSLDDNRNCEVYAVTVDTVDDNENMARFSVYLYVLDA